MRSCESNHLKTNFFSKISYEDMHAGMGYENGPREGAMQTKIMQVWAQCRVLGLGVE